MRSWLTYTAARVGLFLAAFGVVYLFGARAWVALILAWLVSGLASYVLLSRLRDQLSTQTVERLERRRGANVGDRLTGGASREDDLQEAADPAGDERPADEAPAAGTDTAAPAGSEAAEAAGSGDGEAKRDEDAATAAKDA
ncbi:DUF4229 domain-containing protein [Nocardiopsis sp. CT-R113]|uniref:DUF4229 domain-containing protein n=1 Tax=Nocardiopsis codii TaxID=3065942 RepID=A0ABU7K230_9ACTN|nr:DUF4229 domain-containing protein [Nocardiopsis sp. CT-R113]MEE2036220.1 DUF4229 domain-containing protein [Nocardiopsis sp. CT-R113]